MNTERVASNRRKNKVFVFFFVFFFFFFCFFFFGFFFVLFFGLSNLSTNEIDNKKINNTLKITGNFLKTTTTYLFVRRFVGKDPNTSEITLCHARHGASIITLKSLSNPSNLLCTCIRNAIYQTPTSFNPFGWKLILLILEIFCKRLISCRVAKKQKRLQRNESLIPNVQLCWSHFG